MTTSCKNCKSYLCVNCVEDVAICLHSDEFIKDVNAVCPLFELNPILDVQK